MGKAYLMLDEMPEKCSYCLFMDEWKSTCRAIKEHHSVSLVCRTPDWCPLRPLPERYYVDQNNIYDVAANQTYADGWNDCLDEVLGSDE